MITLLGRRSILLMKLSICIHFDRTLRFSLWDVSGCTLNESADNSSINCRYKCAILYIVVLKTYIQRQLLAIACPRESWIGAERIEYPAQAKLCNCAIAQVKLKW